MLARLKSYLGNQAKFSSYLFSNCFLLLHLLCVLQISSISMIFIVNILHKKMALY